MEPNRMGVWMMLGWCALAAACGAAPAASRRAGGALAVAELMFLTRDGCANTPDMRANIDAALRTMGIDTVYQVIDLAQLPEADARRGYPTPTLLYAGRDVFGMAPPTPPFPEPT